MEEILFTTPLSSAVDAPVELAYILLDQGIRGFRIQVENKETSYTPPLKQWLPVNTYSCPIRPRKTDSVVDPDVCQRCHLVLNVTDSPDATKESAFSLNWDQVHPFDGTVRDVAANLTTNHATEMVPSRDYRCHCKHSSGDATSQQRSDAALLAGLLVACAAHVHVVNCSVMIYAQENADFYSGSILFTLAFPHLLGVSSNVKNQPCKRCIVPRSTAKRSNSSPVKPLNSALRLLLTLVRSDWGQLENFREQVMDSMESRATQKVVPFFSSILSLGDIYNRIQGSTSHANPVLRTPWKDESSPFSALPLDILQERIAPFLKARDLAAVRSTSAYLYWSLRSVVPGLKLRLYKHQIDSLFWMRRREASLIQTEADCLSCNEALHRDITGGASVRLASNPVTSKSEMSVLLDPWTGLEIFRDEACDGIEKLPRRVARGGLLCDDPGLGKTITVLALILQTSQPRPVPPKVVKPRWTEGGYELDRQEKALKEAFKNKLDDALFREYWKEQVEVDFRRPALLTLLNDFCKAIQNAGNLPIKRFQKDIASDAYGDDFAAFQKSFENAIEKPDVGTPISDDVSEDLSLFRSMVQNFKRRELYSIRKSFSNENYKPNSRVAALIAEQTEERLLKKMVPSSGTLLVVPSVLIEHWKTQIQLYVNTNYCTIGGKIPLIFEYRRNDLPMPVHEALDYCQTLKTHTPVVFIDNSGSRRLPSAEFLAMFQIVITTTHRFMNEAKFGTYENELETRESNESSPYAGYFNEEEASSVLLKVHWLRLIVDEGHSMGHDKLNSTIQFASWVRSRRRWAMTGTPTKHNAAQIGQLRGLVRFLQHDFFGPRLGGDVIWKKHIAKCWRDGDMASFFRLRSLLCFLMRRHTKFDIVELPSPSFFKNEVTMSCVEVNTYNTLVSAVQVNLLLTSMEGKTSGFQDSLLHRSQAKNARLAIQNIRRVCTGWSRVIPTISNRFYLEALDIARSLNLPEKVVDEIGLFMTRAGREELSPCSCCGIRISTLLLMSCCGGQICTECMDSSTPTCYLCDKKFDIDELQRFQPGFVLEWRSNLDLEHRPNDISGSDLFIEPVNEPVFRPSQSRRRTKKFGDGHECEYDRFSADGHCIHCLEEHNFCCLMNDRGRCDVCHRVAEDCPKDESKSFFLSRHLLELVQQKRDMPVNFANEMLFQDSSRPLKVIVYSQFRAALNYIGDRLLRKFGNACVAEYFGPHRKKELQKFTTEPVCFCLLLTKDGSEGLDLSFVTNIIFLEEIFDKSLEDQVVARAWRMGAKGKVTVETLIAKNSIEEVIGNHIKRDRDQSEDDASSGLVSGEKQRLRSLLLSLRLITDHHNVSLSASATTDVDSAPSEGDDVRSLKRQLVPHKSEEITKQSKRLRAVRFLE